MCVQFPPLLPHIQKLLCNFRGHIHEYIYTVVHMEVALVNLDTLEKLQADQRVNYIHNGVFFITCSELTVPQINEYIFFNAIISSIHFLSFI